MKSAFPGTSKAPAQKEALERAGVKRAWWFVIIGKGSDDSD